MIYMFVCFIDWRRKGNEKDPQYLKVYIYIVLYIVWVFIHSYMNITYLDYTMVFG